MVSVFINKIERLPMSSRHSVPTPALVAVLLALLLVIGYQIYQKKFAIAGALSYRSDWAGAIEEAKKSGKPILLNFGGDW